MPSRILREGIISSPRVDKLSPMAEILYRRLMSVADDHGRYYGTARVVRAACWPTHPSPPSEAEVDALLAELASPEAGLICTYSHKDQFFLEIINFRQQTRAKSKFPEHDINCYASATQVLSTTRARRTTNTNTTTSPEDATQTTPGAEWPETSAAVRKYFPATDDALIAALVLSSAQEFSDVVAGSGASELKLTDAILAEAVHQAYFPKQESAGLFKSRVPRCVKTWAIEAKNHTTRSRAS